MHFEFLGSEGLDHTKPIPTESGGKMPGSDAATTQDLTVQATVLSLRHLPSSSRRQVDPEDRVPFNNPWH